MLNIIKRDALKNKAFLFGFKNGDLSENEVDDFLRGLERGAFERIILQRCNKKYEKIINNYFVKYFTNVCTGRTPYIFATDVKISLVLETIANYYDCSSYMQLHQHILCNKYLSSNSIERLYNKYTNDKNHPHVLIEYIATRPNTPATVLKNILSNDKYNNSIFLSIIAKHPNASNDILEYIYKENDFYNFPQVIINIARNPNISWELLLKIINTYSDVNITTAEIIKNILHNPKFHYEEFRVPKMMIKSYFAFKSYQEKIINLFS